MAPRSLQELWLAAPDGKLSAREQARAWALREAWRAGGKPLHGVISFVARGVSTNTGGQPGGPAPTPSAVQQLFRRMDRDEQWFPGKLTCAPPPAAGNRVV